jgi:hypothetical protein
VQIKSLERSQYYSKIFLQFCLANVEAGKVAFFGEAKKGGEGSSSSENKSMTVIS